MWSCTACLSGICSSILLSICSMLISQSDDQDQGGRARQRPVGQTGLSAQSQGPRRQGPDGGRSARWACQHRARDQESRDRWPSVSQVGLSAQARDPGGRGPLVVRQPCGWSAGFIQVCFASKSGFHIVLLTFNGVLLFSNYFLLFSIAFYCFLIDFYCFLIVFIVFYRF